MRKATFITAALLLSSQMSLAAMETYKVDGDHAQILFVANHLGFSKTYGMFKTVSGEFKIDDAALKTSSVEMSINADSLTTLVDKKDQHLKSPDFLDVKQFPKITFKSDSITKSGNNYEIKGQLTLHGVTKPVTMKFNRMKTGEDPWKNIRTGGEGRMTIKRSDFGINFMKDGIPDDVEIIASVEGIKQK